MESKEYRGKFWKGVLVGVLVTALAGLVMVCMALGIYITGKSVIENRVQTQIVEEAGQTGGEDGESSKQNHAADVDMSAVETKLGVLEQIISGYFLFDVNSDDLESGIYKGFMNALGDPYSEYYTKEEYDTLVESTTGTYCGIGVLVSQNRETGLTTVIKVYEGTPSEEAGMRPGDILSEVDGTDVMTIDLDLLVSRHVRGEEGTYVNICVYRESIKDYVDLKIQRRQIEFPTVESKMLEDNTGYVLVSQFDSVTPSQFIEAIEELEQQGMEKLLIDLRYNPGGVLDSAVEMMAYLLPEDKLDGMLLYTEDRNGKGDKYYCKNGKIVCDRADGLRTRQYPKDDGHQLDMPIAVLVNDSSASAAEAFAGCMQDYEWASIVGVTTFGKGVAQNVIPLGDGTAMKLTTAHYFTPSGKEIHEKGVTPDVEIEPNEALRTNYTVEPELDNQLQEALKVLEKVRK